MTDKLVMLAVLAAGLIGDCDRGERGAPQSSPAPTAEAQERTAVLAERIAQVASSGRGDCQKLAGDLRKLADEQKPQLLETSPRAMPSDDKDDESLPSVRGLDGAHAARVEAARQQMRPSLDSCKGNPDVRDALKRLTR